jgi:hypothetical protein
MTRPGDPDAALLAELAALVDRLDPVPDAAAHAARQAFTLRPRHGRARVLALVRDTALGVGPVPVRGPERHVLDFAGATTLLTVEVGRSRPGTVRLRGLLDTERPGALLAHWPDGELSVAVDRIGGFAVDGLPAGPLCLAVRAPGEPTAVTPWFLG